MACSIDEWLEKCDLGELTPKYAAAFADNHIDFSILPQLTNDDLLELGIKSLGHRKKLLQAIAALHAPPQIQDVDTESQSDRSDIEDLLPDRDATVEDLADRRQLTVMFCDLVGSTELSTKLDPEDLRDIMTSYQDACKTAIEAYGGYVNKYLGDGILACFGYPVAFEDNAERSILAGLKIVKDRINLQSASKNSDNSVPGVRIGIATGPVVVGHLVGEGDSFERGVVGETPNLAARLQGLADPNEIVVCPATRMLAGGSFEYVDSGHHSLKGIEQPVSVWTVQGHHKSNSRFDAARGDQLLPLIGRREEMDTLTRRWRRAASGEGQLLLFSADAGLGKSRLVREFRDLTAEQAGTIVNYQCSPHHQSSALYPIINQLQYAAGFSASDSTEEKLDKLEALLTPVSESIPATVSLLGALLTLPYETRYKSLNLPPAQQKDQTLEVLVSLLEELAAGQPVLVIFEDLHWVDPTSLELLQLITERISTRKIMMVCTHRPEFTPPWVGEAHVTSISLVKLDSKSATSLVDAVTGGLKLPQKVLDEIIEKTSGIPLFVEELTKTVVGSGLLQQEANRYVLEQPLSSLAIPVTLQDSLMARLDRLSSVKDIAQICAVIGREFSHELLELVVDIDPSELTGVLHQLSEAGLVFRQGTPPRANYYFKHALIRDTAYASLLKSKRKEIHRKIATVLKNSFPASVESQPEVAALHFDQAGYASDAIMYWRKAATLAVSRWAMMDAHNHLGSALAAQAQLPECKESHYLRLEILAERVTPIVATKSYASQELVDLHEDALSILQIIGDDTPKILPIIYARYAFHMTSGQMTQALTRAQEFLATAERLQSSLEIIIGRRLCATVLVQNRDPAQGCRYFSQVVRDLDDSLSDKIGLIYGTDTLAATIHYVYGLLALGKIEEALRRIDITIARAESVDHANTTAYVVSNAGIFFSEMGDVTGVERCIGIMKGTLKDRNMPMWEASLVYLDGVRMLMDGQFENASELIESSRESMERLGFLYWRPIFECNLARAQLALGDYHKARESVLRGLAQIDGGGEAWMEPELYRVQGMIIAASDPDDPACYECYQTALTVSEEHPNKLLKLRAAITLAESYLAQKRTDEAYKLLAPVYSEFSEEKKLIYTRQALELLSVLKAK